MPFIFLNCSTCMYNDKYLWIQTMFIELYEKIPIFPLAMKRPL